MDTQCNMFKTIKKKIYTNITIDHLPLNNNRSLTQFMKYVNLFLQ